MSRLTELPSPSGASRSCSAFAALHRRHLGLGQPQAGAAARHRLPGHHGDRAATRASAPPTSPTRSPSRSSGRSPASRGSPALSLVVGQLDRHRRRPVRVRHRRQGDARPRSSRTSQPAGLPSSVTPQVSALNINASPVIIASVAGTSQDGLDAATEVARTEIVPALQGIDGVATVDLTGGLQPRGRGHARPGEAHRDRHLRRPGQRRPGGEQPHPAVGPDQVADAEHPGLDDRLAHLDRPDREPRRRREGDRRRPRHGASPGSAGRARLAERPARDTPDPARRAHPRLPEGHRDASSRPACRPPASPGPTACRRSP